MNEFKEWDWVCLNTESNNSKLLLIFHIDEDGILYDQKYNLLLGDSVRHATPKEVEAGRRL